MQMQMTLGNLTVNPKCWLNPSKHQIPQSDFSLMVFNISDIYSYYSLKQFITWIFNYRYHYRLLITITIDITFPGCFTDQNTQRMDGPFSTPGWRSQWTSQRRRRRRFPSSGSSWSRSCNLEITRDRTKMVISGMKVISIVMVIIDISDIFFVMVIIDISDY